MTSSTLAPVGPAPPSLAVPGAAGAGPAVTDSDVLLADGGFIRLVRWVFTARLVCLALAAPDALSGPSATVIATSSLGVLTLSSLVFSRSSRLIRILIRHPLLASIDAAVNVMLLVSIDAGQPAALTVICSALAAGLLFPRRSLVVVVVPLAVGSLGAATLLGASPGSWSGWLALMAGLPALVVGVSVIGAVVRRNVGALIDARHEVAEAVAAVGAADERARLARDMHDFVGKSLHGISLGAKALCRTVERDPVLAGQVAASLAESADQAAREARTLLVSLRAGQTDRPTVEVIAEVIDRWRRETGVAARLTTVEAVDADPPVTGQMASALGEILHNVAKHARATEVEVVLSGGSGVIEMTVSDDGVGFDRERARAREASGHFGLRGLGERAAQVGGEVEIVSTPGRGTTVRWTASRHPAPA